MLGSRDRHWSWVLLLGPLLCLTTAAPEGELLGQAPKADDAIDRAAAALYDGIRVEVLPNGLRVFLKPVPAASTVTTMVAYNVGSAD